MHKVRQQISAVTVFDQEPVTIFVDAIDSYYPTPCRPGFTTVNLRSGVTHDIECSYFDFRHYLTRNEFSSYKHFPAKEHGNDRQ